MNKCLLFLIGMPLAGKSYWGARVAQEFGLQFIDLDTVIVAQEGRTIPELFQKHGEDGFREIEHEHLEQIINDTVMPAIISCGGGTPCFYDNMELMKDAGTVIYLEADIPYLLKNQEQDTTPRPLLAGKDPSDILTHLLLQRKEIYTQAHYILPTKDISLTTFDQIISLCINRQ